MNYAIPPDLPPGMQLPQFCAASRGAINRILEVLRSLSPVQSHGTFTGWTAAGVSRRVVAGTEETTEEITVKQFEIGQDPTHITGSTLSCKEVIEGGLATSYTIVIIPPELRSGDNDSDWDGHVRTSYTPGVSQRRTVEIAAGAQFEERIYPFYAAGDRIWAVKSDFLGVVDGAEYIDLNVAGRHWECTFREIPICDPATNTIRYIKLKGTTVYD